MLRKLFAVAVLCLAGSGAAWAAPFPTINQDVGVCDPNAPSHCIAPDASGNVPITGTITASLGGFTPSASGARMTPITVTTSDSSGTLPTGAVTVVSNVGSNPMYCNVNGVAATTSDQLIASNSWFAFTIPAAITTLHCIATGGSTTANGVGGAGLPTGAGGGSGGGGGGGAITMASGAVASGAYSAGSYAAGALAAGAFASGAGVDGWDLTQGAKADSVCGTATGTCSVISLLKFLNTAVGSAIPAGPNLIGKVGIDQTTPGTTNGVQVNAALPAGTNTIGNVGSDPSSGKGTPSSVAINVSTATTTQLVAISGSTKIYVTSFDVIAGGTGNITFEYGTGSNCGTGTTALTGAYNLTAQAGIAKGNGVGAILIVPAGNALCVLTSAAVQMSGSLSYQQF